LKNTFWTNEGGNMDHTIVHFEIPAKNTEKLKKFYSGVFGWKIEKGSEEMSGPMEYWLIETVPVDKQQRPIRLGVNGGMYKKQDEKMKQVNYIAVESADEYIEKIKKLGGKIINPKQEVPQVGWVAIAEDPEGNQFGILQPAMNR
jgi:predicted enzyme related to lactoylglutathione lyase